MTWTSEDLQDVIVRLREHGGDTTEIEVKLGVGGCPELGPTLCAFGNMPNGGTIIVGLDEGENFAVVGLRDPATIEAGIASQARNIVVPPVRVSFEEALVDDLTLVIATVYALGSSQRPCRHQGQAYLRQADGDYVMSEQEIQQIIAMRERPRNDAAVVPGATIDDLDSDLVSAFLSQVRATSRRLVNQPEVEVLQRKGILAPDGSSLTVAGLYALGSYPQEFVPSLAITAAVQLDARTGERTRDLVHLDGPLPALLDGAMEWVARNTLTTIRFDADGHGRDVSEIPMIAVRELIANALVHRDLSPHAQGKRVEIRLTGDQLVITNPGGLYGVSRQQLGASDGKSAVNEYLYEICKLTRTESGARVVEGEGGGIREVQRAMKAANMRAPHFIDAGVRFTAILPRHSLISPLDVAWLAHIDPDGLLSDVQRRIVVGMRYGQDWTNSRVREEFAPIDSREAYASLQDLVSRGLAETSGVRGQTSYSAPANLRREEHDLPRVVITGPHGADHLTAQGPVIDQAGDPAAVSLNAATVWQALIGSRTVSELCDQTGLTPRQIRYALQRMVAAGQIVVDGGQGFRKTTYRRSDDGR